MTNPEECFAKIVAEMMRHHPDVTPPLAEAGSRKRFGAAALKVNGKIFAMLVRQQLGLKLPAHRVDALVAAGEGRRFEPRPGRPMKEWVTIEASFRNRWLSLAEEALRFVSAIR